MSLGKYSFKDREKFWQTFWQESEVYSWDSLGKPEESYIIDTPPPTVSGTLHIGHIMSYAHADFMARFWRMMGKNVFYPIGFDDNGLPTERLVEKQKKVRAGSMPLKDFRSLCAEVLLESEQDFELLFRSAAFSFDWTQKYQTISDEVQKISQMSFLELIKSDNAYRKSEPTIWCTTDRTALSQADLEDREMESLMNYITFSTDAGTSVEIMTTRPELLPCCVAVLCNPEDERYAKLVGKKAFTPIFGVEVPIIADDLVIKEKGTGLVMCCTFGDITDISWYKKHNLPLRAAVDKSGKMTNFSFLDDVKTKLPFSQLFERIESIKGLKIKEAREQMLKMLSDEGSLKRQEKSLHSVKCAERSGDPVEIIVESQWHVRVLKHKDALKKNARKLNFYPKYMQERLINWIDGLSWDWCISRQRFFGVPFPVWYSKRPEELGKPLFASMSQLPVDPSTQLPEGYSRDEVEADLDVMDTWATSSITPQISAKGISNSLHLNEDRFAKLYPATLRPQAHEIIRTWAFYTILKGYLHNINDEKNQLPWKDLMISGWCLASDGQKMSKSKGNVLDPRTIIQEKGSDCIRYWASSSSLGADTCYSPNIVESGGKLVNKLYNAASFVFTFWNEVQCDEVFLPHGSKEAHDKSLAFVADGTIFEGVDVWILHKLWDVIKKATDLFKVYEYYKARDVIEAFFWKDFCDNYLEIVKTRCYGKDANIYKDLSLTEDALAALDREKLSAVLTAACCLHALIRLFAPFLPHVCEEINFEVFGKRDSGGSQSGYKSVHSRFTWPIAPTDASVSALALSKKISAGVSAGDCLAENLAKVRKYRAENNLSMKSKLSSIALDKESFQLISLVAQDFKNVTNCDNITEGTTFSCTFSP